MVDYGIVMEKLSIGTGGSGAFTYAFVILVIMFHGTPDLHDAIINWLNNYGLLRFK